jgi:hypothetical protein
MQNLSVEIPSITSARIVMLAKMYTAFNHIPLPRASKIMFMAVTTNAIQPHIPPELQEGQELKSAVENTTATNPIRSVTETPESLKNRPASTSNPINANCFADSGYPCPAAMTESTPNIAIKCRGNGRFEAEYRFTLKTPNLY